MQRHGQGFLTIKVNADSFTLRKVSAPKSQVIQESPVFYQTWKSDVWIVSKICQSVDANHCKTHVKPRKQLITFLEIRSLTTNTSIKNYNNINNH